MDAHALQLLDQRIHECEESDRIEASRAVSEAVEGDSLGRHLREAGLVRDDYSADAVLERLKQPGEESGPT